MKEELKKEILTIQEQVRMGIENMFFYAAPSWFEYKYKRKPTVEEQLILDERDKAYEQIKSAIKILKENPFSYEKGKGVIAITDNDGAFIYASTPNKTHDILDEYKKYLRGLVEDAQDYVRDIIDEDF